MHPKSLATSSKFNKLPGFSKRKYTSHFGFKRVFGKDGKNFFDNCEEDCACLEVIFGKGDAEMKEDISESVSVSTLLSEENSMIKAPTSELVFETDGYEVVCLVDNDTPDFEHESKNLDESSHVNSFKMLTSSDSFYSMKQEDDLEDEPFEGYEVESGPVQNHLSDNSLVVYNDRPPLSPMSKTKYSQ